MGFHLAQYTVDENTTAIIAPIKSKELVALSGIADQSLFAQNVRGHLGRTKVNRDIVKSIRDNKSHKLFPLFHNGITIIAKQLKVDKETISAEGYFVVNGCQSLTSLFENKKYLTEDLRILTKFIQIDPRSELSQMITQFSNNQNGVKARDFMANNPIQIRLQNEFQRAYQGSYAFEIKRGESAGSGVLISNEEAGLYLMAFDSKEPWATHRKYTVFEEKHADLFARPEVTADRIVLCQVIIEAIKDSLPSITNSLFSKYLLTQYLLLYITRLILESDALAPQILNEPHIFVRDSNSRDHFRQCILTIVKDIVIDLNAELNEYGDDFDYRGKLRDSEWTREFATKLVSYYQKLVGRGRIASFSDEWQKGFNPIQHA